MRFLNEKIKSEKAEIQIQEQISPVAKTQTPEQKSPKAEKVEESEKPKPNPAKHTTLKYWNTKDGSLKISTYTKEWDSALRKFIDIEKLDGTVVFSPKNNEPTKLMNLMKLLIDKKTLDTSMIVAFCYGEERNKIDINNLDKDKAKNLLKRVATLVSDLRKKISKAGINPDIILPFWLDERQENKIKLKVRYVLSLDERHDRYLEKKS